MSHRFVRLVSSAAKRSGVWNDFKTRSSSLKIQDEAIRKGIFEGVPPSGPPSIQNEGQKTTYHSPELIDEVFVDAYNILQQDAEEKYLQLEKTKGSLSAKEIESARIAAEELNPEVIYNARFDKASIDRSQPVYRKFLREQWKSHDLMITMQRLEQLHVIPDTLPTLEPSVDVKVKFGHNTDDRFADWVSPGTKMPAFAVAKPPTVQIQEFDVDDSTKNYYSVIVVNPDVPDLARNSYKTTLNYGLYNVPLTFTDNTISPGKLLTNPEWIFCQYTPLLPEKNVPTSRACLWVFKQAEELSTVDFEAENFDIRSFSEKYHLKAVGAHVWRQSFDRSVEAVRSEYGLPAGRVFDPIRGAEPLL